MKRSPTSDRDAAMRIVLFCHSLLSDWNHGNAHFLRGLVTELSMRGHSVRAWEPEDGWSANQLAAECGELPHAEVRERYPLLDVTRYLEADLDLDVALDGADLVIVHEWTSPSLVSALGRKRRRGGRFTLLFHDTHHRLVTDSEHAAGLELDDYDAVLAFGEALRERYLARGWGRRAYTFHEAADVRVFRPQAAQTGGKDLVWVGNFGDGERTRELEEYLFAPVASLGLSGTVYGVRYPEAGLRAVRNAGLEFGGRLANYDVPLAFAEHDLTVHVPRRPYVRALPGVPTIRVFEALACGIPLVSAPWADVEGLFRMDDFVMVSSGDEMRDALRFLTHEPAARHHLARRGLETILARHTCSHRAGELLGIVSELTGDELAPPAPREVMRAWD